MLFRRNLTKSKRRTAIVVDIRTNEEFRAGHVPNSINIPADSAFQADGTLVPSPAAQKLANTPRGRVICVVGNKGESAPRVSGCVIWEQGWECKWYVCVRVHACVCVWGGGGGGGVKYGFLLTHLFAVWTSTGETQPIQSVCSLWWGWSTEDTRTLVLFTRRPLNIPTCVS